VKKPVSKFAFQMRPAALHRGKSGESGASTPEKKDKKGGGGFRGFGGMNMTKEIDQRIKNSVGLCTLESS
jgi:hypothetical protein